MNSYDIEYQNYRKSSKLVSRTFDQLVNLPSFTIFPLYSPITSFLTSHPTPHSEYYQFDSSFTTFLDLYFVRSVFCVHVLGCHLLSDYSRVVVLGWFFDFRTTVRTVVQDSSLYFTFDRSISSSQPWYLRFSFFT